MMLRYSSIVITSSPYSANDWNDIVFISGYITIPKPMEYGWYTPNRLPEYPSHLSVSFLIISRILSFCFDLQFILYIVLLCIYSYSNSSSIALNMFSTYCCISLTSIFSLSCVRSYSVQIVSQKSNPCCDSDQGNA